MTAAANKAYDSLEWICLILACWFIGSFLYIAMMTMNYPFHLEWMEGHIIDTVQRVVEGKGIYVEPSLEFIPYLYTPYYYYAVAFVSLFTGVDFFPARLLSTLSILGCGAILYRWVRREGGSWRHGLISAGLFFATYKLSGRWFDVSRTDSLFLLLTLGGLYIFFYQRSQQGSLCAAALLAAAFFTKQSALVAALPVLGAFLFIDWRHSVITGSLLTVFIASGLALLHLTSNGWSSFYLFELPGAHHFDKRYIYSFWTSGLFRPQAAVAALSIMALVYISGHSLKKLLGYVGLLAGLILCSYIMRINSWSYVNVYIPAHAAFALMAGLSFHYLSQSNEKVVRAIWPVLIIVHFGSLHYNPARLIPSADARQQGEQFLQEIAAIEGDIFIPDLQFVQTRAGKKSYAFGMAAFDIFNTNLKEKTLIKRRLRQQLSNAVREGKFAGIVPGKVTRLPEREEQYIYKQTLHYPTEYVTGIVRSVPMDLYVRKSAQ
jgi:hypothetical protein